MGIYGFDTHDRDCATAALLVYAVWRSRDRARFRVTPDVWSQIERFAKASAKRARAIDDFIEAFKPKLACGTIHPRAMAVGIAGAPIVKFEGGAFAELASEQPAQREFLTGVLADADDRAVLDWLYKRTGSVILYVRERLERERPVEAGFDAAVSGEGEFDAGDVVLSGGAEAVRRPRRAPPAPKAPRTSAPEWHAVQSWLLDEEIINGEQPPEEELTP